MIEQHWSLAEKFIKKWFWLYLFSYIIAPMWYIIKIILSTDLSVSEVWLIYWIISLIVLVSAYHDFWITESIYYFVPKFITENRYDKVKLLLFYWFLAQIFTWIIIASIFYFWNNFLAEHYFKSIEAAYLLRVFAFYFITVNFLQIIAVFFMAIQNTFLNKIIELVRMSFTLITTILLFVLDYWNMLRYSYAWLTWVVIWTIFAIFIFYNKYYKIYLKNIPFIFDKVLLKEIMKYSLFVFLSAQAWTILSQIDMQMIIYLLWTKDAWYYTNYLSIISIPFLFIWPAFWLIIPVISELYWKKELIKIKQIKTIFTNNFLIIWIFSNILFFVFAEPIAYTFFWEKFLMSWTILKYSILLLTFNFLLNINFQIMSWIWKVRYKLNIMLIAIISNIISTYILIKYMWVVGASLATWLWWVIIWILSDYYLWKDYKIKYEIKTIIKNICVFTIVWIWSYYFIAPNLLSYKRLEVLFIVLIIWLFYIFIYLFTNYNEIKWFINEIKNVKKSLK